MRKYPLPLWGVHPYPVQMAVACSQSEGERWGTVAVKILAPEEIHLKRRDL